MSGDLTLAVRLTADGSGLVGAVKVSKDALTQLGEAGGATGRAVATTSREVERLGAGARTGGRDVQQLTRFQREFGTAAQATGNHLRSLIATYLSFETAKRVLAGVARETMNAEKVSARLDAVLRATGQAAGYTRAQMDALADSLAGRTLFDDDTIRQGIAVMATFRSVQGETFREAIELATDLAGLLGSDLQSAILQVGKALEDPAEGLTALRRSGVSFSDAQREMIQRLADTGRTAEAQALVLKGIREQLGGAGAAQNTGLVGAATGVTKAWNDMLEAFGRAPGVQSVVNPFLNRLKNDLRGIEAFFKGETFDGYGKAVREIERIDQDLARMPDITFNKDMRAALKQRRLELAATIEDEARRQPFAGASPKPRTVELSDKPRETLRSLELEAALAGKSRLAETQFKALKSAGFEPVLSDAGVTVKDFEKLDPVFQNAVNRIKQLSQTIDQADLGEKLKAIGRETQTLEELQSVRALGPDAVLERSARRKAVEQAGSERITDPKQIQALQESLIAHERANRALETTNRLYDELRGPQENFAEKQRIIAREFANGGITAEEMGRATRRAYLEMLDSSREWEDGVTRGLIRVADEAGDMAKGFENATVGAFRKSEDAIIKWARTGKLSAGDLFQFIGDEAIRMAYRAAIVKPFLEPLAEGFGGWLKGLVGGGSAGTTAGVDQSPAGAGTVQAHEGGMIGGPNAFRPRVVDAALFENAPRFHGGGQLGPGERAIIGKEGEVIGWPEQMRRAFGGSDVKVEIIDQRGGGAPAIEEQHERGPDGRETIRLIVRKEMTSAINDGAVDSPMRTNYGVNRAPATRRS